MMNEGSPRSQTVADLNQRRNTDERDDQSSSRLGTSLAADISYAGAASISRRIPIPHNSFRTFPVYGPDGRRVRDVIGSEITIRDLSGGTAKYKGPFSEFSHRTQDTLGADLSYPGFATLAQDVQSFATPDPTGNLIGIHSAFIFDTFMFGTGSGLNVALFKETSATDRTPVAVVYTPTSSIISFSTLVQGSATVAKRLVIGRSADPAQIISDNIGTVAATMDASVNPLWGAIGTSKAHPSGGFINQYYMQNGIYTLSSTQAATTAPVIQSSGLPGGGFALGEYSLSGGSPRCWYVIPKEHNASGMLLFGTEKLGYLYHFNQEGNEYQVLQFNAMPLGILQAAFVGSRGIIATDGEKVVLHTGSHEDNLNIFSEAFTGTPNNSAPIIDSDWYLRCRGFAIQDEDIYALVQTIHRPGTFTTFTSWWKYNFDNRTWNNIISWTGMGTANTVKGILAAGSHGVSFNTKTTIFYANGAWWSPFLVPHGENPYVLYRQTAGAAAASGNLYVSTGDAWARWTLPDGLEGYPSVVESIACGGDVVGGGGGATIPSVTIEVARQTGIDTYSFANNVASVTFDAVSFYEEGFRLGNHKRFPDNTDFFFDLYMTFRIVRGTNARFTPQVLPITLKILTFLDPTAVRSPRSVWGR